MQPRVENLNVLYRTALEGIHRSYVFMRLGVRGVSVRDFEDTELPGRKQISVIPERMSSEQLANYLLQYRAWTVGNGLRELVETYSRFLDDVYMFALSVVGQQDQDTRMKSFERSNLQAKVRMLYDDLGIDGGFSAHFGTFTSVRNALAHGSGIVRERDCDKEGRLTMTWRGIEVYFVSDEGVRYRIGDEPPEVRLREPLETLTVDRARQWSVGEKIELEAYDFAEITNMANYEAVQVLEALRTFAAGHGITTEPVEMVRGA